MSTKTQKWYDKFMESITTVESPVRSSVETANEKVTELSDALEDISNKLPDDVTKLKARLTVDDNGRLVYNY